MNSNPQSPSPFTEIPSAQHNASPNLSSANFSAHALQDRFAHQQYVIQKQFWKMFGGAFRIYDSNENLLFYSKQKAFKLKEDIRLYTGEDMTTEVLRLSARKILDIAATYDVYDSATNEKIGAFRRHGFKSMIQDEWTILDALDREIGSIKEESTALALIRRLIDYASYFLPQAYNVSVGNRNVALFKQNFNPLIAKINLDFSPDVSGVLDRRLGIAAAVLLCAIEGKQH